MYMLLTLAIVEVKSGSRVWCRQQNTRHAEAACSVSSLPILEQGAQCPKLIGIRTPCWSHEKESLYGTCPLLLW